MVLIRIVFSPPAGANTDHHDFAMMYMGQVLALRLML
jgi:hypothetical protein